MINLNTLLNLSADLICTINTQGKFVDVSRAAFTLLGYEPAKLQGKHHANIIDTADLDISVHTLAEVRKGSSAHIQNRYVHKAGYLVPLNWSASWDFESKLIYAVARSGQITLGEETMRNSLEESNQRYRLVSKATSDAIWDWDIVNGSLYWGDNFESIFGYDLSEVTPSIESWTTHIHPDDAPDILKSIYELIDGIDTNWKEEYRYRRADGSFADVVDRGFVIRDKTGKALRMVGAMHDISERRKALRETKRITEDLYKHNRELHEFAYIVSHNLRSPVANIMGITSLLEIEKDVPETVTECTDNLKVSIHRLDEVIKDLSKILSSKDNVEARAVESVDLAETICNIQTDLADTIEQNAAQISVTPGSFMINSHKAYIYSIFFNLITNSLKYRSAIAPHIFVDILNEDERVRILFTDNGCGIDLIKHGEELFKPYKRFHSRIEGKGLGMFLVKSHLEALGGEITVVSEPGMGTTFTIYLPKGNGHI